MDGVHDQGEDEDDDQGEDEDHDQGEDEDDHHQQGDLVLVPQ